jgi:glycine/D-amino acid oxidase-like deaminating enzyme
VQEIKVIGSGVAGLCVAKELVSRGSNVIVIDKTDAPSSESCSWWAGGMLAPWCEGESTEDIIASSNTPANSPRENNDDRDEHNDREL